MAAKLKGSDDLQFWAFTRAKFPSAASAVPLVSAFVEAGDPFVPTHFGGFEPLRTPFDPADTLSPAQMLSDRPRDLFLKRSRPSMEASFTWMNDRERPWIWTLRVASGWMKPSTCGPERFVQFLLQMCTRFPPVFAFCATNGDLARKHTLRSTKTGDDLGTRGMLLNPGDGLPGAYWWTFFGPELVSFFGHERLLNLRAQQKFDCGKSGIGILLQESPLDGDIEHRQDIESSVVTALGAQYFFDIASAAKSPPQSRTPIPGATVDS
jgi:hypothetical protein